MDCACWDVVVGFSGDKAKGYKPSAKFGGQRGRKVGVSDKKLSAILRVCDGVECQSASRSGLDRRANF